MTDFQQLCYQTLKARVPAGKVITYAGLAQLINHPKAHRAVGSAMNKNPFAPEVPCHRVVKSNGELGGFAQDIKIKIKRLQKEGVQVINNKIVDFKTKVVKTI
ncbi:MAG: MGMT family protein [Gammaproteobacteria bacterium]|nr:MAG: MGMT family protein [Gammaproteobacteria bacterium]